MFWIRIQIMKGNQDPDQQERFYSTSNTLKYLEILYSWQDLEKIKIKPKTKMTK